jgi:ubiquinone/menaquinone biosynthesis C-methylase UbiE
LWISLTVLRIILLIPGLRRVKKERIIGPEESIEDEETVRAYDKISRWPQFKMLRKLAIRRLKKLEPRGLLADIGCGPGYFTLDTARAFPRLDIVGLDISEEMLQKAEKTLSALPSGSKITFRQGDIHELPFKDNSLDFAVSTLSMHHWAEPAKALGEIYRVLKPQGQFLIFDTRRDSPRLLYHLLKFAQKFILPPRLKEINEPTSSILASYTPAEVTQLLAGTPFKDWTVKPGFFWLFVFGRKYDETD